jgi:hypothetical protein
MFGCVEEQSEDVAGELGSANSTGHEELVVGKPPQAPHGIVQHHVKRGKQLLGRRRRRAGVPLSTQGDQLFIPERLPSCVREESVHTPADVSQMEAHRCSPARPIP